MSENYTRKEQYLAAIAGEGTAPEPITREEQLLKKIAEKDAGDVTEINAEITRLTNAGAKNSLPSAPRPSNASVSEVSVTDIVNGTFKFATTATTTGTRYVEVTGFFSLSAGKYTLSTETALPADTTCTLINQSDATVATIEVGESSTEFTLEADTTVQCLINIATGATVAETYIAPMLRDASIADDTYVSYGKTNAEITAELSDTGWLTLQSGIQYRKKNSVVYVHVEFPQADIPSGGSTGWVGLNIGNHLPAEFRPAVVIRQAMGFRSLADNQHKITMGQINTSGGIQYNAHNVGAVDNTLYNSIVADFCYPV